MFSTSAGSGPRVNSTGSCCSMEKQVVMDWLSSVAPRARSLRAKYKSAGSWQLGSTEKTAVSCCDDAVRLVARQVALVQLGLTLQDSKVI